MATIMKEAEVLHQGGHFPQQVVGSPGQHAPIVTSRGVLPHPSQVNPQEATESPGSSEELETGVEPLKQAQDTKTRDDRQHAELSTLHPPGFESQDRVKSFDGATQCTELEESLVTDDQRTTACSTAMEKQFRIERTLCVPSNALQLETAEFQQAKHQLEELLQEWSSLLGLLILVVCLDAPEASLKHLVGVERGTDVMQDAFRKLGYATLRLPVNATGLQLRAMIKAASEAKYPDSYKRIFFHFIGHGIEGGVYTSDKHISLSEIVQPFKRIPQIPKVFILDCCRQFPSVPPFDSSLTAENTLIIYSTMPGCEAYAPTHAGPLMTEKLAELFCTEKSSITDIAIRLPDELNRFQLCPITMLQLNQPISLLKEQEDKSSTEAKYPDSYKRIFFHFIGHGVEGAVYTKDDCVPLSDIVQPIQRIPQIPKVFIFDCCRRFANFLSSFTLENTLVIYPTKPGHDVYACLDVGPLMTEKLAFLFHREKNSIRNIVTKLSNELSRFQVCSVTPFQLNQPISLLEERESAMRPTNVQLQDGILSWDLPALGDYFHLINFTAAWKESSDSEEWKHLDNVDPHQKHFNMNASQFSSASGRYVYVAVQANYQGKCVTSKECRLDLRRGKNLGCQCSKSWWIGFGVPLGLLILLLIASIVGISVCIHIGSFSDKVLGYNGDTVECDQLSPVYSSAIQVSECGDYNDYRVAVYKAQGELKTYEWVTRMYDTNQSASVGRFGIPINVDQVPYLFEGSKITMSICLQSMNITTVPVGLFIFDDLDKRSRFIERKSDGKTSVHQWQLPVGSHGQMHCSNITYDVQYGGYYCLALDSPSNVIFKENLTENVISVNTSEYQVDCTVAESDPCIINIPFGLSPLVRILCHIPEYDVPAPPSTYLCSSKQPRLKLYIASGILAFLILFVTLVGLCFSRKCQRCQHQYQRLS